MFEISSKKVDFEKKNTLIKRNINLDTNLDCFILISTDNDSFGELLINNILDFFIDKISKKNAYNDFSIALESINSFIKKWESEPEKEINLDIIISILNDNTYIFSNIGNSSCYLINSKNELLELTNKDENKKFFSFLSSGDLFNNDIIISSTRRLLNYLSKSDLIDGLVLSEDIKVFNKNIYNILMSEITQENILVSSMKYNTLQDTEKASKLDVVKEQLMRLIDNKISKNIIGYLLILKDKINSQSKMIKNIIFVTGIIFSIIFLYSILSTVVGISTQTEVTSISKENIIAARNYLKLASDNIANPEIFNLNIDKSKKLIDEIQENQLFLTDIAKINDDINILKKQFNKIEIFEETTENIIFAGDFKNPVEILKNNLKTYIITTNSVVGPIMPGVSPKINIFSSLEENETFTKATFIGDNMYILTSSSKVVEFNKNGYFNYIDVSGQATWEKSKEIDSYAQNIYLIGKDDNQIYKHAIYGNEFKAGTKYLLDNDLKQIGEILSIAIDGGFYILKKDLSIIKFYSNPYRLEKITINKLPDNYDIEKPNSIIDLKTRSDLNYVYLLLNDKIWVFKTNTNDYKSTKSLTYVGQIEGGSQMIKDFYVNHDGEIEVLNDKGIYKIIFEISDDRLLIR